MDDRQSNTIVHSSGSHFSPGGGPVGRKGGGIILSIHYDPNTDEEDERSSFIRLRALYGQPGQRRLSAKTDWLSEDTYNLSVSTKILNFPSKFYGLGPKAELSDEEVYNPLELLTAGFRSQMLFPDLFLGPIVTFSHFDIEHVEEGGILDSGRVLGSDHATLVGFEACYLQEGAGQRRPYEGL